MATLGMLKDVSPHRFLSTPIVPIIGYRIKLSDFMIRREDLLYMSYPK